MGTGDDRAFLRHMPFRASLHVPLMKQAPPKIYLEGFT